jgi:hypothetical protein
MESKRFSLYYSGGSVWMAADRPASSMVRIAKVPELP